jgi:hypothetical protein
MPASGVPLRWDWLEVAVDDRARAVVDDCTAAADDLRVHDALSDLHAGDRAVELLDVVAGERRPARIPVGACGLVEREVGADDGYGYAAAAPEPVLQNLVVNRAAADLDAGALIARCPACKHVGASTRRWHLVRRVPCAWNTSTSGRER